MYQLTLIDQVTGRRYTTAEPNLEDAAFWQLRIMRALAADRGPGEPITVEVTLWDQGADSG